MENSDLSSKEPSRAQTPNKFTAQANTAEDLVKSTTVGLVQLSDFRKRRAQALEQKDRDSTVGKDGRFTPSNLSSGFSTPISNAGDGAPPLNDGRSKKRKKIIAKGKLSFGVDEEESQDQDSEDVDSGTSRAVSKAQSTPDIQRDGFEKPERKRIGPNARLGMAPKALTKSSLLKEAETKEQLRKEFLIIQEAVKATEVIIPFIFFDGTNIPGGACKIKKGEHIWLFLDRSRKVGAALGVNSNEKGSSRREWARVGVDDLMLVRGDVIIPHHYDFYYFIVNKTKGPKGRLLFDYQSSMELADAESSIRQREVEFNPITVPGKSAQNNNVQQLPADDHLEGSQDDPIYTKVVDRRWYERNKHIFPASTWEDFDPGKDYSNAVRKDTQGNSFFF